MPGLRFPDELRISAWAGSLEAAGIRARIAETAGELRLWVDGLEGRIALEIASPAAAAAVTGVWPFGMEGRRTDAAGSTVLVERVFAPAEHPLIVLECESPVAVELRLDVRLGGALRGELRPDLRSRQRCELRSDIEHAGLSSNERAVRLAPGATARIAVWTGDSAPDVDGLANAALARSRRRAAERPALRMAGSTGPRAGTDGADAPTDPTERFAGLEHALRSASARGPRDDAAEEIRRDDTAFALALLGLNDRTAARQALAHVRDPERRAALAGAWAAWTGEGAPLAAMRPELSEWLRTQFDGSSDARAAGVWHDVALALAPAVIELLGDAELMALARERRLPDARGALAALGAAGDTGAGQGEEAAGQVLALLHGVIGVSPDAPRGRVGIAPRLERSALHLRNLSVGDARFRLDADFVSSSRLRLLVEQTAGSAPYTVVLSPRFRARRLTAASVDGRRAELDAEHVDQELNPRVQVASDHAREVILDFE